MLFSLPTFNPLLKVGVNKFFCKNKKDKIQQRKEKHLKTNKQNTFAIPSVVSSIGKNPMRNLEVAVSSDAWDELILYAVVLDLGIRGFGPEPPGFKKKKKTQSLYYLLYQLYFVVLENNSQQNFKHM